MSKYTNIPSEIRNLFNEKRQSIVMNDFLHLLDSLKIYQRCLVGVKRANCQLTNLQVFQILILMPFFAVSGLSHYTTSVMSRMFGGKKDILYSFMAQYTVDWRNVIYRIAVQLVSMITVRNDFKKSIFRQS